MHVAVATILLILELLYAHEKMFKVENNFW